MNAKNLPNTIIRQLTDLLLKPVTEQARDKARLHLLDWIGCAVIGSKEPAGVILLDCIDGTSSSEVFVLGGLGNILEMDDIEKMALLHPGPCIVPASIKFASDQKVEIVALLDAIVRGYEATIRLGRALGVQHYANWHSTGTCGLIGASAACASLLKLEPHKFSHALALSVSQTAGFWQTRHEPESMGKQLHTAHAARAGFESALLASKLFSGPLTIIEGEQGLFNATAPTSDPEEVLKDYGKDWLIQAVSFKPWPACRHVHSVIEAGLKIREVGFDENATVRVTTYGDALKFCDNADPSSTIEAKFSLQHSIAVALSHGVPRLKDFSSQVINDSAIKKLRQRVTVEVGEEFEARYPAHFGARVSVADQKIEIFDALGDPENPMTTEQIIEKAETLMQTTGLDRPMINSICDSVFTSETLVEYLYRKLWKALR